MYVDMYTIMCIDTFLSCMMARLGSANLVGCLTERFMSKHMSKRMSMHLSMHLSKHKSNHKSKRMST